MVCHKGDIFNEQYGKNCFCADYNFNIVCLQSIFDVVVLFQFFFGVEVI